MNWFGLLTVILTALTALLALMWRGLGHLYGTGEPYDASTMGTVSGMSDIRYAGHAVPKVNYEVEGRSYSVAGPLFTGVRIYGKGGFGDLDSLDDVLTVDAPIPTTSAYENSALSELLPMGSQVKVFFDSKHPVRAYVVRPVDAAAGPRGIVAIFAVVSAFAAFFCLIALFLTI